MPLSEVILFRIARSKEVNEIFYLVNTLEKTNSIPEIR